MRTAVVKIAAAIAVMVAGMTSASAQKAGGTMRMYVWDNPPSASIHEEATVSSVVPFMPIFNNLVLYDQHQQLNSAETIKPELAESWAWDDTKTKLTFKLRSGVTWHDGKPFTAADVVCTMDLLQGRKEGLRKNPRKVWWSNLKQTTTKGDHEVTFHLERPQLSFLSLFATGYTPMYPCHVTPGQMRTKPVGTGPYVLSEFKSNEIVRLTKNASYWRKDRPYIDALEWRVIPNRSTRILAFLAGDIDMTFVLDLTPVLVKDIKAKQPKAVCEIPPTNNSINLIINRDKPPFDDAKIRQALALALDRQSFNTIIYEGMTKVGGSMMAPPEGNWGMPPEMVATLPGYGGTVESNRAEARKIMEGLGYGPDKPLKMKVSTRTVPLYRDPAIILVDQLKSIYVDAELETVDASIWFGKAARGDYTVGVNATAPGLDDPDVNFYENYACGSERNYTKYCNPEVDKLIDAQSRETDVAKRKEIVWEVERLLANDVARPIIVQGIAGLCWMPYVKGFTLHHNGIYNNWRYEDVWLDR